MSRLYIIRYNHPDESDMLETFCYGNATQEEIDSEASEQMRKDARTGRAIETLRNKYGNSTIEFYHGVVTIQEIRDDDVYIRLGEGDTIDEALFYAGLMPTEDTQEADHV